MTEMNGHIVLLGPSDPYEQEQERQEESSHHGKCKHWSCHWSCRISSCPEGTRCAIYRVARYFAISPTLHARISRPTLPQRHVQPIGQKCRRPCGICSDHSFTPIMGCLFVMRTWQHPALRTDGVNGSRTLQDRYEGTPQPITRVQKGLVPRKTWRPLLGRIYR